MNNIYFELVEDDSQIKTLEQLCREIWTEHYISIIGIEQINYMLKKFQSFTAIKEQIKNNYEYYFVKSGNDTKGYIGIQPQNDSLFLSKYYIKACERGKGFGRKAFEFVKEKCIQKSLPAISLTVNKHNTVSIGVYEKMGLKKVKSVVTDIGSEYIMDDYIFEYTL